MKEGSIIVPWVMAWVVSVIDWWRAVNMQRRDKMD